MDDEQSEGPPNDRMESQPTGPITTSWRLLWVLSISELLGGFSFSLLAPFYTQEAHNKGLSTSSAGIVYASVFVTSIIASPLCAKLLSRVSAAQLFVMGNLVAGTAQMGFGALDNVERSDLFLVSSVIVRVVAATGEALFFAAVVPIAMKCVEEGMRSRAIAFLETMFGMGLMLGPIVGGVLYSWLGFAAPFLFSGLLFIFCGLFALYLFSLQEQEQADDGSCIVIVGNSNEERRSNVSYRKLVKVPGMLLSCGVLTITSVSVSWYLPSLQPHLASEFNLGSVATGALFTLDGGCYAVFAPVWGWMLDHRLVTPLTAFCVGNLCVTLGLTLLGPLPGVSLLVPKGSLWVVVVSLAIHGFGVAANFMTSLTFMLRVASETFEVNNIDDCTRGMISSLWFLAECIGGYVGSSLGAVAFDHMGFENSLVVVALPQLLSLTLTFVIVIKRRRPQSQQSVNNTRGELQRQRDHGRVERVRMDCEDESKPLLEHAMNSGYESIA